MSVLGIANEHRLMSAGIGGAGLFVGLDQASRPFLKNDRQESCVELLDNSGYCNDMWIALAGLGNIHGEEIARALQSGLGEDNIYGYANYSASDVDLDRLIQSAIDHIQANNIERIKLYGHSMGGLAALAIANALGDYVKDTHVFLDCTPFDLDDVKVNNHLLRAAYRLPYNGGALSKFIALFAKKFITHEGSFGDCVNLAISGPTHELVRNQLGKIDKGKSLWAPHSNEGIRVSYMGPEEPNDDNYVNTPQALEKFRVVFPNIEYLELPKGTTGHASIKDTPSPYIAKLLEAA